MEYIRKIHALTSFLSWGTVSENQICRFVTLDSFAEMRPVSAVLAFLRNDATFQITGIFGMKSDMVGTFEKITLAKNSMIAETVKTNRVHINGTAKELESQQLSPADDQFVGKATHMVVVPVLEYGVLLIFTDQEPDIDSSLELFLIAVSGMIALDRQKLNLDEAFAPARKSSTLLDDILTPRQSKIVESMRRGQTNASIAQDIGFSESLVRQETMDIFKKLGVSGRKELLERSQVGEEK